MSRFVHGRWLQRAIVGGVAALGFCAATPSMKPAEAAFVGVGVGIPGYYYAPAPACAYYYPYGCYRYANPVLCSCWGRGSRMGLARPMLGLRTFFP